LWIGATFLFILGLIDDFISIKPQTKLVGQILAASFVALVGFRMQWFTSLTLDTMVTIIWIVGVTNAFNLIDNMDGLCAGIGLIASIFLFILFKNSYLIGGIQASLIIAGALAAFLIFNFKPASIFMGDSGSLVIGFILSVLTLAYAGSYTATKISLFVVPILILLVPIFDTLLVSIIRILSGRKASAGGRDHTSHRLVLMGLKEKNAVLFLYGIGILSGLSAIFITTTDTLTSPTVLVPIAISLLLMGVYLAQLRVYPEKEFSVLRDKSYTPILVEITYKRQILLVILDFGMVSFAYYLSYRLRFDAGAFSFYFQIFLKSLPAIIACKLTAFFIFGIYRAIWGYMSTSDVVNYIKASLLASLLSVVAVTYFYRFQDFSKGIFIIDWLLTTGYLLASRGSFKLFIDTIKRKTLGGQKAIIYGAGRGGEILLREILNNKHLNINPVGFIDDDIKKTGKKMQGYPIMGNFRDIEKLYHKHHVEVIILAFANGAPTQIAGVKNFCRQNKLLLKSFSITLEDMDLEKI
jgi:UDP-GlcNAc:undecaprenyl-phosphate GlcNAc-1-phosphate transferase